MRQPLLTEMTGKSAQERGTQLSLFIAMHMLQITVIILG